MRSETRTTSLPVSALASSLEDSIRRNSKKDVATVPNGYGGSAGNVSGLTDPAAGNLPSLKPVIGRKICTGRITCAHRY